MSSGCIDRVRTASCGNCARKPVCDFVWPKALGGLLGFLEKVAERRTPGRKVTAPSFRREVERRMESMLADGAVRIEDVARTLGCSRQTLYRKLKAEGTTFERLVDNLRHRLAIKLVRGPALGLKEIAWRLGFSDPAAFSRAFKRWTGTSPSAMRSQPG